MLHGAVAQRSHVVCYHAPSGDAREFKRLVCFQDDVTAKIEMRAAGRNYANLGLVASHEM